ncbi:MAG: hypothetical protein HY231_12515 [Acidobacteria bacterium]|nr:hypothetical protein [Acidobacteriota bacterium]
MEPFQVIKIKSAPKYAQALPTLAGIKGKYQVNFGQGSENGRQYTYEKENDIPPESLWSEICVRRHRLGIPLPKGAPKAVRPTEKVTAKKKWWEFWK